LTVFGMMQRICFPQHGRQQVVSHELLQLGTREPQLGAHVLQLGAPQAQPSLPP